MKKVCLVVGCVALMALSGCTPDMGGQDYAVTDAGQMSTILRGSIRSIRNVMISNVNPAQAGSRQGMGPGAGVGAVAGGVGLGAATKSTGGALAGALAGGVLGHLAQRRLEKQKGKQYEIALDDGRLVSVAQGLEPALSVGQRVMVIQGKERTRVVPDTAPQPVYQAQPYAAPGQPVPGQLVPVQPAPVYAQPLPAPIPQAAPAR